ncbi:hypothetical protein ABZ619_07185 [Streptomyces sp. NPDC007851]|uniref:hypothetical protein n=1 Tax=Streptomyces sp. NPDC007851 TaxID=3155008 RepID=UPI0033F37084
MSKAVDGGSWSYAFAWRGIAIRCDKSPDSYLAGLHPPAPMLWIKDPTRTTD